MKRQMCLSAGGAKKMSKAEDLKRFRQSKLLISFFNQSINQSGNQAIRQSINQSINHKIEACSTQL
jgi:hypothetical protein